MPFIYQKDELVSDAPQDETWKCWAVSDEYHVRLIHGERPQSWDKLLLPDRAKLHELTSGSELWQHISQYAPSAATLLYIALTSSSQLNQAVVTQNIKDMMHLVVAHLGSDHALHSTPSSKITNDPDDPEALPISVGSLADELDAILAESFFPFTYVDLM
jgi:hypothetical protein